MIPILNYEDYHNYDLVQDAGYVKFTLRYRPVTFKVFYIQNTKERILLAKGL